MKQSLTYRTSFTKDSYLIFNEDIQIGKLYKKEWLGSPIETTINGQGFRFVSNGFFKRVITIFDKVAKHNIGTVTINSLFMFSPSVTLHLADNKQYSWTTKDIFSNDWQWQDLSDMKIAASSKEPLDIFKQKGTISLTQQNNNQELLIALGIHLRNVVQMQSLLTRVLSFIAVAVLLTKLFS